MVYKRKGPLKCNRPVMSMDPEYYFRKTNAAPDYSSKFKYRIMDGKLVTINDKPIPHNAIVKVTKEGPKKVKKEKETTAVIKDVKQVTLSFS